MEVEALRAFSGGLSVKLLDRDLELGAILLERLVPGNVLSSMGDDVAETSAAARVVGHPA